MSDSFPWYTEWNGIFMPVGDAAELGCAMAIGMMVLSLVGYLFYLLIKLVTEGFKALFRKEWGKGFVYLGIVIAPFVIALLTIAHNEANLAAKQQASLEAERQIENQEQFLMSNPEQALLIEKIRDHVKIPGFDDCINIWPEEYCYTDEYRVTNISALSLLIGGAERICDSSFGLGFEQRLEPGISATIYCEQVPEGYIHGEVGECITAEYGYYHLIGSWCIEDRESGFRLQR